MIEARRQTILVIDDSPFVLAVTRVALEEAGYAVAIAEDLVSFERHRVEVSPDLILVDVQMPEAFGDDIASTLRGVRGVKVPILLVSSLDEEELAQRAANAEVAGFVSKRAGLAELVRRVNQVLGSTSTGVA